MSEQLVVSIVSACVVAACLVGIVIIAVRERRRTASLPQELRPGPRDWGWFGLVFFVWWSFSLFFSEPLRHSFPLYVLVPGLDLSFFLAFSAFAVFAVSWVFRAEWSWRTGLWISWSLLFPALYGTLVVRDIRSYETMQRIWILAGLLAVFLTPQLARLTYLELFVRRGGTADGRSLTLGSPDR